MNTDMASIVGVIVIGVGLGITIWRNGKAQKDRDIEIAREKAVIDAEQAKRDTQLQSKVDQIAEKQNIEIQRLTEVKNKVCEMSNHCAATVATFTEKLANLEKHYHNSKLRRTTTQK